MSLAKRMMIVASLLTLAGGPLAGQARDAAAWTAHLATEYIVTSGVVYLTQNNYELKLDIYARRGITTPNATVLYYHGGGWVGGSREAAVLQLAPYLEMGYTVVNVSYRLGRVSPGPAAVEDCRCALRWVIRNAKQYNFDVNKLVLTGHSAGGHLSLITAMLPLSAGLDRQCPPPLGAQADPLQEQMKVAAVINWYGITDVGDLFEGPNAQNYAIAWMGSQLDRMEIARRVSPLSYVRAGLPPILTIHGDADLVVPYSHATRLQAALTRAGVPNQLVTIAGGGHGGFTREQNENNYAVIREFLAKYNLKARP
jgi:acetyl esterase/lipase